MDKDRIVGSAKDIAGKVESNAGGIAGDAKMETMGRAREAGGSAQHHYGQAKDAARQPFDSAADYTKEAYANGRDAFRDGSQAIANKVQENPLGSLLVAGAIGFAAGLMMMRQPLRLQPPRSRYFGK